MSGAPLPNSARNSKCSRLISHDSSTAVSPSTCAWPWSSKLCMVNGRTADEMKRTGNLSHPHPSPILLQFKINYIFHSYINQAFPTTDLKSTRLNSSH